MNRASEIEAEVRATINTIVDPCSRAAGIPAGLIDMGLVRSLEVRTEPDGVHVRAVVGVTEYGCMLGPAFATEINRLVRRVRGGASAEVTLDDQFDWVPEDMTESYRHALASRRCRAGPSLRIGPQRAQARNPRGSGPEGAPSDCFLTVP